MRGMRSGLTTVTVTSMLVIAAVVGCSASGGGDATTDDGTLPAPPPPSQLPPPSSTGDVDADPPPPKDAGKDSTVDAGPPPPVPGTPCTEPDKIVKKACGACGEASTVCLAAGDGGPATWTEYSACTGELAGGCTPGTTTTEACGNCGTQVKTCSKYCAWSTGACAGQPADSCVPLGVELSTAGCATADTYRSRSCKTDCTWNSFSTTCGAPPKVIEVPPTAGSVNSTIVDLVSTKTMLKMASSTCPTATINATVSTPYDYIQVHNPNAKSAVVTVYDSLAPGGVVFHTILASYAGATPPSGDPARKACVKGVNTFGDDTITGDFNFASLSDTDAVTVPANGSVEIYVAAYNAYAAANPKNSTGPVMLSVRLDSLK
jgi:hypothetical protein